MEEERIARTSTAIRKKCTLGVEQVMGTSCRASEGVSRDPYTRLWPPVAPRWLLCKWADTITVPDGSQQKLLFFPRFPLCPLFIAVLPAVPAVRWRRRTAAEARYNAAAALIFLLDEDHLTEPGRHAGM